MGGNIFSFRKIKSLQRKQHGFALIEVLVGITIFALVGTAVMVGLQNASMALLRTDVKETAKDIAQGQMEYIKSAGWNPSYTPYTPTPAPADFDHFTTTITVAAVPNRDDDLQKITVSVSGPEGIYNLEGYKVKTSGIGQ